MNDAQNRIDQQMTTMVEGMKTGFEKIKALLDTHNSKFQTLEHELRFTRHSYNINMTICREMIWKWMDAFKEKMDELIKTTDELSDSIHRTVEDISQTYDIFINKDRYLRPKVINWVHWFSTSWTEFIRRYCTDLGRCRRD